MASDQKPSYTTIYETVRGVGSLLAPEGFHYLTEIPADGPESQLVIHLSCMAHYTPHIPLLAQQILQKIGLDCLIVGGPENCCGELHKHFKDHDLEKQTAKIVMSGFRRAKPRKVVSICPDCDEVFSAHGVDRYPYQHTNISDLFIEHLDRLKADMRPVELRIVPHFHTVNEARQRDAQNMMAILRAIPGLQILEAQHALGPGIHCQTLHPMPALDQERMFEEAHVQYSCHGAGDTVLRTVQGNAAAGQRRRGSRRAAPAHRPVWLRRKARARTDCTGDLLLRIRNE
jgi:hypothetical protein